MILNEILTDENQRQHGKDQCLDEADKDFQSVKGDRPNIRQKHSDHGE